MVIYVEPHVIPLPLSGGRIPKVFFKFMQVYNKSFKITLQYVMVHVAHMFSCKLF